MDTTIKALPNGQMYYAVEPKEENLILITAVDRSFTIEVEHKYLWHTLKTNGVLLCFMVGTRDDMIQRVNLIDFADGITHDKLSKNWKK